MNLLLLIYFQSILIILLTCVVGFRLPSPRMTEQTRNSARFTTPLAQEPPLKVMLVVEPTPFNYISGYANRFKEMLNHMKKAGDEVSIVTPDKADNPPLMYAGYQITSPKGFQFPMYKSITLSLDFKGVIPKLIRSFKPDILHVSSPSCLMLPSIFWAKFYSIPLLLSYHTDLSGYSKTYLPLLPGLASSIANMLIRLFHSFADLTLCTSPQLQQKLVSLGVPRVDVWQKGINTEVNYCLNCVSPTGANCSIAGHFCACF
jgi:sulfoquinovosyltransferase